MKIAALYDIHGNLPALEAALADVEQAGVDCLVIGGDVVAGPLPNETIDRLQALDLPIHYIHGNAESELLRCLAGLEPGGLSPYADDEARWVAQTLTTEHRAFIATWADTVTLTVDGIGDVLFCHATPQDDITVFTKETPEEHLIAIFGSLAVAMVICGHTHMQFNRTAAGVRVVNAGSVGMPFGHTGADWLLLDGGVALRHTDYDLAAAAERIRRSAYLHAEEFTAGNVLQAPTVAQAMAMLTRLESTQRQIA